MERNSLNQFKDNSNSIFGFEPASWVKQILSKNTRKGLKCSCDASLTSPEKTCSRAMNWMLKKYKIQEFPALKKTYEEIYATQTAEPEQIKQIQKDVYRTFPETKLFAPNSEG